MQYYMWSCGGYAPDPAKHCRDDKYNPTNFVKHGQYNIVAACIEDALATAHTLFPSGVTQISRVCVVELSNALLWTHVTCLSAASMK